MPGSSRLTPILACIGLWQLLTSSNVRLGHLCNQVMHASPQVLFNELPMHPIMGLLNASLVQATSYPL